MGIDDDGSSGVEARKRACRRRRESEEDAVAVHGMLDRKDRGAFFTPPAIARFLARWAIAGRADAKVLDPTCGEGVFLLAAAEQLRDLGGVGTKLSSQVFGVDVHEPSVRATMQLLEAEGLDARVVEGDVFLMGPRGDHSPSLPGFDAVVGNPPFVRYQRHIGAARQRSANAALRQGVRLSGLASSWAPLLVHAGGLLKPEGRLAMVIPAELLTVGYAEPVRRWLRGRFAAVKLVFFERLQFVDVLEDVLLLLAQGTGGCDAFSVYYVEDAEDLFHIQPFDEFAMTLADDGKWTDLLLSIHQRQLFKRVVSESFVGLEAYGALELGTVTGANAFFTLSEETRKAYGLVEGRHVRRISPPGTRHLRGLSFTAADWERLRDAGEMAWILCPDEGRATIGLTRYLTRGEEAGVHGAYKCRVRTPWWRPPLVSPPDLFFTYMSHRYPRLVTNQAEVSFVNSMHGIRVRPGVRRLAKSALPLLALNSVTMLGAEANGRSYGGGILKMEPREAASLPVPNEQALATAWAILRSERLRLDNQLKTGHWQDVVARIDEVLLIGTLGLSAEEVVTLRDSAHALRSRRLTRGSAQDGRGNLREVPNELEERSGVNLVQKGPSSR